MPMIMSGCNEGGGAAQTSTSSVLQYHYGELDIAKDPTHPNHALPPIRSDYRRILDIGCGMGQSLMALPLSAQVEAWGVDCDVAAIVAGSRIVPQNVHLLAGTGEALPLPDETFDLVFSRVALPYMDVPSVIAEVARVLRHGGEFWAMLHPPGMLWDRLREDLRSGKLKDLAVCGYIGVNSLLLHILRQQFRIKGFCETVQTYSGMQRILAAEGLQPLPDEQAHHLIVRAFKA